MWLRRLMPAIAALLAGCSLLSIKSPEKPLSPRDLNARILAHGFTILPASDYGKLRDFYDKVALADRQQIALTAGK